MAVKITNIWLLYQLHVREFQISLLFDIAVIIKNPPDKGEIICFHPFIFAQMNLL
jgi:hypothetical protein